MNRLKYTTTKQINVILIDVIVIKPLNSNSNSGSSLFQTFKRDSVWNCPMSSKDPGYIKHRLCFYLTKIPLSRYSILFSFELFPLFNWETTSWWRVRPRQHMDVGLCMKWNIPDLLYICVMSISPFKLPFSSLNKMGRIGWGSYEATVNN